MKSTLTILLILLTISTFGQTKDKYEKLYDSLMAREQYDELINYFEKELKKYPKSEDILRSIGYVHIAKNNLDLGEKYYLEALTINPKCARCYMNIGRVYTLRNDNRKALDYFNKAVITDSTDALVYSGRAQLKEFLGDKSGALSDYDKAIKIDPNNSQLFIVRGLFNLNRGNSSLAISDFTKAIKIEPENYYPYLQRANIYYNQRRMDEALKNINKAIELDSNQFSLYHSRGAIFHAMEEYEKAVTEYSKSISLNKDEYLSYLTRASSYYKLENPDACCSDYLTIMSLINKGKVTDQEAINETKNSLQDLCDSTRPSYYYQRGVGYYNLKSYQKAIDIYSIGLKKFPESAMTLSFKGNAHLALGEYEKALECYYLSLQFKDNILPEIKANSNFANQSPESITSFYKGSVASIHFSIAECKVYLGLLDEALIESNKSLELLPDIIGLNKEAHYNLRGHIYMTMGKYDLAISDFNMSILINKDFSLAYVNRAIAKVSLAEKVKITSVSMNGNFSNQPMNVNWTLPNKSSSKKSESNILSALTDCNTAIEIEPNLGFAYYIRGQIKQMLNYDDYCLDLLKAKELGLAVDTSLLIHCVK